VIESSWSDDSLGILRARLAQRRCRNLRCRALLRRRTGQAGWEGACGYCRPCYELWWRAGKPEDGPPAPAPHSRRGDAARERASRERAQRVERFAAYLAKGYPVRLAADRVDVSLETGYVYSGELKRRQREEEAV
jgi:hypothetical protein